MGISEDRSEITFFDVETTVPSRSGQRYTILEFGAILVCPRKLVELDHYSTLIRPSDLSLISSLSVRCNGITRDAVISAPSFADIADRVFDLLHGRIWAGHNILRFDCRRIREAFAEVGRPAPEPKGTIDSLALLTQRFGRRAGDMKMATLAAYFGLGRQTHRSLDDVRMNLEVLKYCATVLFLESSLPDIFTENSWVSPNVLTRNRSASTSSPNGAQLNAAKPSSSSRPLNSPLSSSPGNKSAGEFHPILSLVSQSSEEELSTSVESDTTQSDPFSMRSLSDEIKTESLETDSSMEEQNTEPTETSPTVAASDDAAGSVGFLEPDKVSISSIKASFGPLYRGTHRIIVSHGSNTLQLRCTHLKVRFGISTKYVDHAGRPRLSFVVDATPSLCRVLEACDSVAQKLYSESGGVSDWRNVVCRKPGYTNYPTVRLNIPTAVSRDFPFDTEIYQKESSGTPERLKFSKFDAAELDSLFPTGIFIDAFFSLDTYDYQQSAGIRLVAKKLFIHSK